MLVPVVIMVSMVITSIGFGSSLVKLANTEAVCDAFWLASMLYVAMDICGSCGIAVFRLIAIKYESLTQFIIGPKRLMAIVLSIQAAVAGITTLMYYKATEVTKTGSALSFCVGRTLNYLKVINAYQKDPSEIENAQRLQSLLLLAYIATLLIELGSYITIFIHIFRLNAQTPVGLVSPDIMRKRRLSNVLNLWGQSLAFLSTFLIIGLVICVINLPLVRLYFEEATVMIVASVLEAIKSVVLLYSSPEMREFMFERL